MTYTFYEDAGHGWLKVPVKELVQLDIVDQITRFSYLSPDGRDAYLEEDQDYGTFADAYERANGEKIKTRNSYSHRSRVRNYPDYSAKYVNDNRRFFT